MNYLAMALKFGPPILCVVLAVLLWGIHNDNSALRGDKRELRAELADKNETLAGYVKAVATRDTRIVEQNASIEAWKAAAQQNRADYEAALWAAQQRADTYRGRANELLALTAPDGELAQCRAARDLLEAELVQ